jgi:hypothetical protein
MGSKALRAFDNPDPCVGNAGSFLCAIGKPDSNPVERMIKPIVLTRRNRLFASHDDTAQNWAVVASIVRTSRPDTA